MSDKCGLICKKSEFSHTIYKEIVALHSNNKPITASQTISTEISVLQTRKEMGCLSCFWVFKVLLLQPFLDSNSSSSSSLYNLSTEQSSCSKSYEEETVKDEMKEDIFENEKSGDESLMSQKNSESSCKSEIVVPFFSSFSHRSPL
ncbi:hypothetical protein AMTR_s00071p00086100 [Amborella trichopoda]|uniref:Uncharacterized protein n=1 Tax=Amborella trichopoda TaxID=13333 RepID=U5D2R5_AMBTC|nr:hypothetical protein AMTR_s00071p00086100 [Amborella trichopoda]